MCTDNGGNVSLLWVYYAGLHIPAVNFVKCVPVKIHSKEDTLNPSYTLYLRPVYLPTACARLHVCACEQGCWWPSGKST